MQERERRGGYKVAASLSPILVPNTKSLDRTFVRLEMVLTLESPLSSVLHPLISPLHPS